MSSTALRRWGQRPGEAQLVLWGCGLLLAMVLHEACGYPHNMARLVRGLAAGSAVELQLAWPSACPTLAWAAAMSPIGVAKILVDVGCVPMWALLAAQLWAGPYLPAVLAGPVAAYLALVMPVRYSHFVLPLDPSGCVARVLSAMGSHEAR